MKDCGSQYVVLIIKVLTHEQNSQDLNKNQRNLYAAFIKNKFYFVQEAPTVSSRDLTDDGSMPSIGIQFRNMSYRRPHTFSNSSISQYLCVAIVNGLHFL